MCPSDQRLQLGNALRKLSKRDGWCVQLARCLQGRQPAGVGIRHALRDKLDCASYHYSVVLAWR
jgi:hypothetical protein